MKASHKIEAITFDVGGTLIQPWPSVGHIYAEVAIKHGIRGLRPEILNHKFGQAWKALKQFNHGRDEWATLVDQTFSGMDMEPPSKTFFPELFERFTDPSVWQVFEDVVPTLETLAAHGTKLGIISNWDERLIPLLGRLKLDTYFDAIIVSCDVGFPKPSPVIFEHATKKLGVAAQNILHVGDSLKHDIEGGRLAGFQTRKIDRDHDGKTDGYVRSLRELEIEVI